MKKIIDLLNKIANGEEVPNKIANEIIEEEKFQLTLNEWLVPLGFDKETWKQLLDYITDLQKEIENLKDFNIKLQWSKDRLDRYDQDNQIKIDKAIEKLESIRAFGLRSGKTLFSTLINESIDILRGDK